MKHFGDITKINGANVPSVNIITGGSPCQDLSVAGKRAGLAGERSGLFMEQIRIIKEMRNESFRRLRMQGANVDLRLVEPRFMVWENVPGAFSSNKGEDFRAVLEETARVADQTAVIPGPTNGKWTPSGCIMADGWSIAWRVHDAQFWGVLQRRKRIALVADFAGGGAPEILFERKSLSRDPSESSKPRERTTTDVERSIRKASAIDTCYCIQGNCIDRADTSGCNGKGWRENECYTLNTIDRPAIYDARGNGYGRVSPTITGDHEDRITDYTAIVQSNWDGSQISPTLTSNNAGGSQRMPDKDNFNAVISFTTEITPKTDAEAQAVAYGLDRASYNQGKNAKFNFSIEEEKIGAQTAKGPGAVCQSIVRRLTPLECERLQGYPDNWTNIGEWVDSKGKKHKDADSPRYKALGNSIALPFWEWMAKRMVAYFDHEPTMASLFDGIGGFPLTFSRAGAIPIWASEIEEFPIAVTKIRFPET